MPSGARVFVASVVQAHRFFQIHFLTFRLFSFCLIEEKKWGFSLCKTLLFPICLQHVLPTSGQKWRTDLSTHASIAGQNNPEADPKTTKNRWLFLFFFLFFWAKSIIAWWFSSYNRSLIYSCCSADLKRSIQVEPGRFTFQRSEQLQEAVLTESGGEEEREREGSINLLLSFTILQCAAAVAADKNWIYLYSFFFSFFLSSLALASFLRRWLSVSQTPGWRYDHSGAGGETQAGMEGWGGWWDEWQQKMDDKEEMLLERGNETRDFHLQTAKLYIKTQHEHNFGDMI